jgi:hypoxanthine phosphoribosyltransferase
MSVFGEAIGAIKEALKLADDVKRTGETLKEISRELREHERRIKRVEAKWEAAVELSAGRGGALRRLDDKA